MAMTSLRESSTETDNSVSDAELLINLTKQDQRPTGHRLADLVQALTGCSPERAELAVSDPAPAGPASSEDALRTMAEAIVRLRPRQSA